MDCATGCGCGLSARRVDLDGAAVGPDAVDCVGDVSLLGAAPIGDAAARSVRPARAGALEHRTIGREEAGAGHRGQGELV